MICERCNYFDRLAQVKIIRPGLEEKKIIKEKLESFDTRNERPSFWVSWFILLSINSFVQAYDIIIRDYSYSGTFLVQIPITQTNATSQRGSSFLSIVILPTTIIFHVFVSV